MSFNILKQKTNEKHGEIVDLNPSVQETGRILMWDNNSFLFTFQHYNWVVNKIAQKLELAAFIGDNLSSYVLDVYIEIIIELFTSNDRILPFIKLLIQREFDQSTASENILRQNNLCTRLLTTYARTTCKRFLSGTIKNSVMKIVTTSASYELDETRLQPGENIESNQAALQKMCKEIIDNIVMARSDVPIEIRTICNFLWENCVKYYPDKKELPSQIVGGYLFLRLFCPAIASPENFGLLGVETKISSKTRRNLIMVTKVLQNIANQTTVVKEPYLQRTKEFAEDNFLLIKNCNEYISTQTIVMTITLDGPTKFLNIGNLKLNKLFSLHSILFNLHNQLSNRSLNANEQQIRLLEEAYDAIGVPPFFDTKKSSKGDREQSDMELIRMLEKEEIVYRGDSLPSGELVFYIVISRFMKYLKTIDDSTSSDKLTFIDIILEVMQGVTEKRTFVMIFDCSWYSMDDISEYQIIQMMSKIQSFSPEIKNNFTHGYIVHASKQVKKLLENMAVMNTLYGFPDGWNKKFDIVDDWQALTEKFGQTEILIPETSKAFAKRDFHVLKVNGRGKCQDRITIITFDVILNVDPQSKAIINEIPLDKLTQIDAYEKMPHIIFHFTEFRSRSKRTKKGKTERRYILNNVLQREQLLTQIFAISFYKSLLENTKLTYDIMKKGSSVKTDGMIIICFDRLIIVRGSVISHDIMYASLDKIYIVENRKNVSVKTIVFEYKAIKNGLIEKITKKFDIKKEDIGIKDVILNLMTGDFCRTRDVAI